MVVASATVAMDTMVADAYTEKKKKSIRIGREEETRVKRNGNKEKKKYK